MKYFILLLLITFSFSITAKENCTYEVDKKSVKFNWTGYKFSEKYKTPVSGTFDDIFWGARPASSINELVSKLKFQIKTKSVNSGKKIRDDRLKKYFFKLMKMPEYIEGYGMSYNESKKQARIEVNMNSVKNEVVFDTKIEKDLSFSLTGSIDLLKNYKMLKAFESISKQCKGLHTGDDGIAKTWSEVGLSITGKLIKKCKS